MGASFVFLKGLGSILENFGLISVDFRLYFSSNLKADRMRSDALAQ